MIFPDRGNVNIDVAVVVVVADRASQAIFLESEAGSTGDIGKSAIMIVVIERRERLAAVMFRPISGVDQQDVLPAVIVIVEEACSRPHGFGKVLLSEGAVVVFEVNASLSGYISKLNRARGPRGHRIRR